MSDIANRKLRFIEEYLEVKDEALLTKLEILLHTEKQAINPQKTKPSARDLMGVISEKEAEKMKKDIEEACENIDENEW